MTTEEARRLEDEIAYYEELEEDRLDIEDMKLERDIEYLMNYSTENSPYNK